MSGMQVLAVMTSSWAVVMAFSPTLQMRTMMRTKSSRDVSIGYFCVLIVGFLLWTSYGIATGQPVLYIPNSMASLVSVATVIVALRYRRES